MNKVDKIIAGIKASIITTEIGMQFAKHPLYNTIWTVQDIEPTDPKLAEIFGIGAVRRIVEQKLKMLEEYAREQNWSGYIFTHERPYRPMILAELLACGINPDAKLILEVWSDTEFPWQSADEWMSIFEQVTHKEMIAALDSDERAKRDGLDEYVTLYRGVSGPESFRFSWTLDKDRAEWFSERFKGENPRVLTTSAAVSELVGPLMGRGENEMLMGYWKPEETDDA